MLIICFLNLLTKVNTLAQISLPLYSDLLNYSDNDDNKAYYIQMSFGTPKQTFNLYLSAWTTSTTIPMINSDCDAPSYFDPSLSSTFKVLNKYDSITFENDDYISGAFVSDVAVIDTVLIENFNFLLASECTTSKSISKGVLGLGYSNSDINNSTIILWLKTKGFIEKGIFSLYLSDIGFDGDKSEEKRSSIIIGGYDKSKYAHHSGDSIHYIDIDKNSQHWYLEIDQVNFGSLNYIADFDAIIDPGSKYIYGPDYIVKKIQLEIKNRHLCFFNDEDFVCYCSDKNEFYPIIFTFNGNDYKIDSKWFISKNNGECIIKIYSIDEDRWILGQIFLRVYYSIWDYDNKKIGFIESINISDSSSHSPKTWVIILVVILTILIIIVAFIILIVFYKKKKAYRKSLNGPIEPITIN